MGVSIKLKLKGFDDLLDQIKQAGGDIKPATEKALSASGNLVYNKIVANMNASAISSKAKAKMSEALMKPKVTWKANSCHVETGFQLGDYDAKAPSGGYIALFEEYGTKQRKTAKGQNRGKTTGVGFIRKALAESSKQVKQIQRDTLNEILGGLGQK